jgi:hypothetical protein
VWLVRVRARACVRACGRVGVRAPVRVSKCTNHSVVLRGIRRSLPQLALDGPEDDDAVVSARAPLAACDLPYPPEYREYPSELEGVPCDVARALSESKHLMPHAARTFPCPLRYLAPLPRPRVRRATPRHARRGADAAPHPATEAGTHRCRAMGTWCVHHCGDALAFALAKLALTRCQPPYAARACAARLECGDAGAHRQQ